MNETGKAIAEMGSALAVLTAGLQAVMETHPNREALREAWNQRISAMWAGHSALAGTGTDNAMARGLQAFLQQALDASPG